jgi:predicted MPP superfamily phosphohydrolase
MLKFFFFVGCCYVFINAWILWWIWRSLETGYLRLSICVGIFILAACFPILYRNSGASTVEIFLLRAGAFWLGIFIYVFILVLVMEAYGLAVRFAGTNFTGMAHHTACLLVLIPPFFLGCAGWLNAAMPVIKEYDFTIKTAGPIAAHYENKPLTVVAISDMHLGRIITTDRLRKAVELALPYSPDMVLFIGDMLDDHILPDEAGIQTALARLTPRLGLWGIIGNHEYIAGDINRSLALLRKSGISVLRDEWYAVEDSFLLIGRDDAVKEHFTGKPRKSLTEILATVPEYYRTLPAIVLDHQPIYLEEAEEAGIALQLSGHTHYGQIWPFNLVIAEIFENPRGLSKRGESHFVVSVGTGTWGPPMRNNARPEILLLRIQFASRQD